MRFYELFCVKLIKNFILYFGSYKITHLIFLLNHNAYSCLSFIVAYKLIFIFLIQTCHLNGFKIKQIEKQLKKLPIHLINIVHH